MKKAVALAYEAYKDQAPKVVASGKGALAQRIIDKAQQWDIPIFNSPSLTDSLLGVQVDEEIPPSLYEALIEVFIWLNNCEEKAQLSR